MQTPPMSRASRLRLFYFIYYSTSGVFVPYLAAYLRGIGFSGAQIGTVQMMAPLVALPAALSWATLADHLRQPTRALRLAMLWAGLALCALPFAHAPLAVALVMLVYGFGDRAVTPLVDSISLELVRAQPGLAYSRLRLFGSIGFTFFAQALGLLLSWRGDLPADLLVPIVGAAGALATALVARSIPDSPTPPSRPTWHDVRALVQDPRLIVLLLAASVHWMCCSPYHMLYGVFVRDQGLPASITGLSMAVGVSAEVMVLFLFPLLERRLPLAALLAVGFAGSSLRWLLLAHSHSWLPMVAVQLFHGCSIGLFWGSTMAAMGLIVPAQLRVTGQALITALVFGVANAAGFRLSGAGYDLFGSARPLYACASLLELLPLGLTLFLLRRLANPPAPLLVEPAPDLEL